jgi:hypothetical protein
MLDGEELPDACADAWEPEDVVLLVITVERCVVERCVSVKDEGRVERTVRFNASVDRSLKQP